MFMSTVHGILGNTFKELFSLPIACYLRTLLVCGVLTYKCIALLKAFHE